MSKNVIIIASGETERHSIPHFLEHLEEDGITVSEIRIPPKNRALKIDTVVRIVQSVWFEYLHSGTPDKFVILLDVDGKQLDDVLRPFRHDFVSRLGPRITASIQFACAQWHLEAWFFGDSENLRAYLGRDLGDVDASKPDEIQNPKLHLKNLLGNTNYTSTISEKIALKLNPQAIAARSPSFNGFLEAVRNGGG